MPLEQKGPWSGWIPSSSIWVHWSNHSEHCEWSHIFLSSYIGVWDWITILLQNLAMELWLYNIGHFLVLFNAFSFYGQPILLIWTNTFFYFLRYLYKFCKVIHVHFLITSIPDGDVAVIATANLCVLNWWSRIREVAKLQGKLKKKRVIREPKFIPNKISGCVLSFYIYDIVQE